MQRQPLRLALVRSRSKRQEACTRTSLNRRAAPADGQACSAAIRERASLPSTTSPFGFVARAAARASPLRGRDCKCGGFGTVYINCQMLKQGPSARPLGQKRSLCSANPATRKRPLLTGDEEDALRHVAQADGPCRFARAFQNAWEWRRGVPTTAEE